MRPKNASNVEAQLTPKLAYMTPAKRGKTAPNNERKKEFPANALAANMRYESTT